MDKTVIDVDLLKEVRENTFSIVGNEPYYNIIDFSDAIGHMTNEAKDAYVKDKEWGDKIIAEIIIANSFIITFLIGTYIKISKPIIKTIVFSSIEKGIEWIENQIKK